MDVIIAIPEPISWPFWHLPDDLFGLVYSVLDVDDILDHDAVSRRWRQRLHSDAVSTAIWYRVCARLLSHQRLMTPCLNPIDWRSVFRSLIRYESADWTRYSSDHLLHHTGEGPRALQLTSRSKLLFCQPFSQTAQAGIDFQAIRLGQYIVFNQNDEIAVVDPITARCSPALQLQHLSMTLILSIGTNFEGCHHLPLVRSYISEDYVLNQVGLFAVESFLTRCEEELVPDHIINLVVQQTLEAFAYDRILISSPSHLDVWALGSKVLSLHWQRFPTSRFALTREFLISCDERAHVFRIDSGELIQSIALVAGIPVFTNNLLIQPDRPPVFLQTGLTSGTPTASSRFDFDHLQIAMDGSAILSQDATLPNDLIQTTHVADIYSGRIVAHQVGQYGQAPGALVIYRKSALAAAQAFFLPCTLGGMDDNILKPVQCLVMEKRSRFSLKLKMIVVVICLGVILLAIIIPLNAEFYIRTQRQLL